MSANDKGDIMTLIGQPTTQSRSTEAQKLWLKLFSEFNIPFSLVDSPTFRELMITIQHKMPFANRRALTRRLDEYAAHVERVVKASLKEEAISIHIAMDLWESPNHRHYICVMGTYVDSDFRKREVLIGFEEFTAQHTGSNIGAALFSTLESYELLSKVTGVTSDGASNNLTAMICLEDSVAAFNEHRDAKESEPAAMSSLFNEGQWFHCCAHVLNLLSSTFLSKVFERNEILQKVRKVASIIRRSDKHRLEFKRLCEDRSMSSTNPPGEVATRWNASFLLLEWFLKYKSPLAELLKIHFTDASNEMRQRLRTLAETAPNGTTVDSDMDLALSIREWRDLSVRKQFLQKFYDITEHFNRVQCTLSDALVAYLSLDDFLYDTRFCVSDSEVRKLRQDHGIKVELSDMTGDIRGAAKATQVKRQKYYESSGRVDALYLSHLLDPRYKVAMWRANLSEKDVETHIKASWTYACQIHDCIGIVEPSAVNVAYVVPQPSRNPWGSLCSQLMDEGGAAEFLADDSRTPTLKQEWESYLKSDRVRGESSDFNPLTFWKQQSASYPILAQVARVAFGFAPTSTSCERSFSLARNKIGFRRHSLAPRTLRGLLSTSYNNTYGEDISDEF